MKVSRSTLKRRERLSRVGAVVDDGDGRANDGVDEGGAIEDRDVVLQLAAHGGDLDGEAEVDLFAGGDGAHPGDGDDVIRRSAGGVGGQVGQTLGCGQLGGGGGRERRGAAVGAAGDVLASGSIGAINMPSATAPPMLVAVTLTLT